MGLLRLYLALCVAVVHAGIQPWWTPHDGTQAVQIFFIISGFYMQMIYEKYPDIRSFWMSRLTRIYFPYFAALAFTLFVAVACWIANGTLGPCYAYGAAPFSHNSLLGLSISFITNLTIAGQDITLFVTGNVGEHIHLTTNFHELKYPLYRYLLIPQAWSISLELYFYAIVPALAGRRTRFLLWVTTSTIVMRLVFYEFLGLTKDPWLYRFFPFELGLFICHRQMLVLGFRKLSVTLMS